jgi:hypothetical protein
VYKYIIGLQLIYHSELTRIQADKVVKAVQVYGLDFKTIRTKLRLTDFTPQELKQVYTTQLDPAFCRDKWSPEETKLLVALYTELDGHMKLVQTRFPTKRSLQDMWDHYVAATQDI